MNSFALLARFNRWVNGQLFASVARLDDTAYRKDRKAFFGSIHNTLNHLLVVDRLWTSRIKRVEHGITSLKQIMFDDFAALRTDRGIEGDRLIELVDGLSDEQLASSVTYRRIAGGGDNRMRCDRALITLFNHQTHHRGQITCMLTQAGIDPGGLDVIDFLDAAGPG